MFVFKALNGLVAKVSYCSRQVAMYFCALFFFISIKLLSLAKSEMHMHTEVTGGCS